MASLLERGIGLWWRHWKGLLVVCLVVAVVPGLMAAVAGMALGLLPVGLTEALVLLLPEQLAGNSQNLTAIIARPGGWVVLLIYGALTVLSSAGMLGFLRPIVHDGRPPEAADFVDGIRRYSGQLLVMRVLCALVLGVSGLVALAVLFLGGALLAEWLVPLTALAAFSAGASALMYADYALVVEDAGAMEAVSDSVGVLRERWREAVGATLAFFLISGIGEAVGWLLARVIAEPAGLLLSILPVALTRGAAVSYLLVRYIENVHRGIYRRQGRFAIDDRKAG